MFGVKVKLIAETASFRNPGGQLYHISLPLPPVSTLVGLAGAALGLEFEEVWKWFKSEQIYVGVSGAAVGRGKDLWNYTKRTVDLEKSPRTDILNREFLCFANRTTISARSDGCVKLYYGCDRRETAQRLLAAFNAPVYALTLGSSDDLAKCISVDFYDRLEQVESSELQNVMVRGDWTNSFTFDWKAIQEMPLKVTLTAPTIFRLPIDYSFDATGVRKGTRYESFTFLSDKHRLKRPITVYRFGEEQVPLTAIASTES